jgi:lipopolysaccharide transport system ATP-binding protein
MNQLAIKLENVSKLYRLGEVGTGTLAHDLNRWWAKMRGRPDPTLAIGTSNNREETGGDYAWALRKIDLEVQKGEILGIIGRNGAGKSTLLKLLSRVTAPTSGRISLNGKMASLLEVGTGFHPELTGRENIFLNGAILGMTRLETAKKFDEIVEFSGCAKYIDTPVKRYSSGMYVRLAFAVAAHLEPDILIVDEVLAVGDSEFQRKCIGKLKDVSATGGRTVLFVSHNMASIKTLCPRAVLLNAGEVEESGLTSKVVDTYLNSGIASSGNAKGKHFEKVMAEEMALHSLKVVDGKGVERSRFTSDEEVCFEVMYTLMSELRNFRITATLQNNEGIEIFSTSDFYFQPDDKMRPSGDYASKCCIPTNFLTLGSFYIQFDFEIPQDRMILPSQRLSFEVSDLVRNQLGRISATKPLGVVHPLLQWEVTRLS